MYRKYHTGKQIANKTIRGHVRDERLGCIMSDKEMRSPTLEL